MLAGLATGLAGAFAGCHGESYATLRLEPVDDEALAERYARAPSGNDRELVATAVEEGAATAERDDPPLLVGRPVRYRGAYYRLSSEVVDRRPATRYRFVLSVPGEGTPAGRTVAVAELPAVDRDRVERMLPSSGETPEPGWDRHESVVYADAALGRSVLVPEPAYDGVVHDGRRYRFAVEDPREETLKTYRYAAEEVAADDAAMAARVRERYLFELSGLSGAQRRILESATGEGGYREREPTAAFRDLARRIREHGGITVYSNGGEWLLRYDGRVYWVTLDRPEYYQGQEVARETPSEY